MEGRVQRSVKPLACLSPTVRHIPLGGTGTEDHVVEEGEGGSSLGFWLGPVEEIGRRELEACGKA